MQKVYIFYLPVILVLLLFVFSGYKSTDQVKSVISYRNDTVTFIHVTDPHICNLEGYHPFFVAKRRHFGNGTGPFIQFFKSVPGRYGAEFVVVTGDNIDYYEAETTNGGILDTQVEQYSRLLTNSDVPVYLTLGNHDIASYWVDSDSTYESNQLHSEMARAAWIRNTACFRDGTSYSRVFKIDTTTIRLIFLDNAYYPTDEVADGILPFIIDQSQLLWLNAQMEMSDSDIELVFMHMPLPYGTSDSKKILSEPVNNLSSKSNTFNLLSVLKKNSSSKIIFAGHKHINSINNYTFPNGNRLAQVMTGAFGYDHNNWRVIKITSNNIIICFPGSSKIEYTVPLH